MFTRVVGLRAISLISSAFGAGPQSLSARRSIGVFPPQPRMTKTFGATTSSRPLPNAWMPSSSLLYRSPELFSIEATNFILEGLRVACHRSNSLSITFKDISHVPTTPQLLSILTSSLRIPSPTRAREKRSCSIASRRGLLKGVLEDSHGTRSARG